MPKAPLALAEQIYQALDLVPTFHAEVPLGLTDDMLALAKLGPAALPVLRALLSDPDPRVRKAAVVMLAHVDAEQAEKLLVASVDDEHVRAEAMLCLSNMFLRDPNGDYATEDRFLRKPRRALNAVLKYIDDERVITIDSGFEVYHGPLADVALGAAVRIAGPLRFSAVLDLHDHRLIGLMPYRLSPYLKQVLRARFHSTRKR